MSVMIVCTAWVFDTRGQTPPSTPTTIEKSKTDAPPNHGYLGKLIITRVRTTPTLGQGGERVQPLPAGTVLQVREERIVDGAIYLQTVGGILRTATRCRSNTPSPD
ncbi:MAG: hypothetical protein QM811_17720 [Pirellulales bacterium]